MTVKKDVEELEYQPWAVNKMKGGSEKTMILTIFCVFLVVFVALGLLNIITKTTAKEQLYDEMATSLVLTAEKITVESAQGHIQFLKDAKSIFVFNELERECPRWYRSCTSDITGAPMSPWSEPSEEGVHAALYYLNSDCKTPEIDDLKKKWAKQPEFANYDDFGQYNLIKNACVSILIDKIYK